MSTPHTHSSYTQHGEGRSSSREFHGEDEFSRASYARGKNAGGYASLKPNSSQAHDDNSSESARVATAASARRVQNVGYDRGGYGSGTRTGLSHGAGGSSRAEGSDRSAGTSRVSGSSYGTRVGQSARPASNGSAHAQASRREQPTQTRDVSHTPYVTGGSKHGGRGRTGGPYTHGASGARYAIPDNEHSGNKRRGGSGRGNVFTVLIAAIAIVAVLVGVLAVAHPFSSSIHPTDPSQIVSATTAQTTAEETGLPTPIMAESDGIQLHSAVKMSDLTEILIHNASYGYAEEITTELTEANNEEVMENHGTGRKASDQPTGDKWMTGEFIRCFRSTNAGPRMSAIDCGAAAGSTVYAPVSGKVVLVKDYQLYDKYDDVQIHIQPEGKSSLDVVLIHLENPTVKAGDTVVAGETPIAQVRDVYAYIGGDMQLKDYTAEGDNGNHTHIQVNDATDLEYEGLDDLLTDAELEAKEQEREAAVKKQTSATTSAAKKQ